MKKYEKQYSYLDYTPWIKNRFNKEMLKLTPPCVFGGPIYNYFNN